MDTIAEYESCFYHAPTQVVFLMLQHFLKSRSQEMVFCNNDLTLPMFPSPPPLNPRIAEQVFRYPELPKTLHNLSYASYQSHEDDLLSFGVWKEYSCFIYN